MTEEMNKTTNGEAGENQAQNNGGNNNPPAENGKTGFHPIQWCKDKKAEFCKNHPVAARRIRKGVDMAEGAAVATLALGIAGYKMMNGNADDSDIIDADATELSDDSQE